MANNERNAGRKPILNAERRNVMIPLIKMDEFNDFVKKIQEEGNKLNLAGCDIYCHYHCTEGGKCSPKCLNPKNVTN